MENDITLASGFIINPNKSKIIIDGTYNNVKSTYTNNLESLEENVIKASTKNKEIILKNMNIISSSGYGVIYVPSHPNYSNVVVEYNNVNFTGIELSQNYYGTTKIIDSVIEIKDTNNVLAQKACDSNNILIGGITSINSSAVDKPVIFLNDVIPSTLKIMPNSKVTITTNEELMNGTNRLDLIVGHGAEFLLTTGNGFSITTTHGARNVLIEEEAKFTFIENNHQRVPMWSVFGDFIVKENASLEIINTFMTTPTDNYNIYFKGTNQNFILDNPKYVNIYTKNANVIYTNNPVSFSLKFNRINMWISALNYTDAYKIDNEPALYWYKDNYFTSLKGTFTKDITTVTSHNLTKEELNKLPDITNFSFQDRKILTIGGIKTNIHPVNNTSNTFSGHTISFADVKIEYDNQILTASSDENGLFEINLDSPIEDNKIVKVTTYFNGCFSERKITTPFNGEITLLKVTGNIPFSTNKISTTPIILPKQNSTTITIVDSRINATKWKLYLSFNNPMIEQMGKVLIDSLAFKKFNNEIIKLSTIKKLVYEEENVGSNVELSNITFSTDKGLLLFPSKDLFLNEDYKTSVIWSIEY